MTVDVTTLTLLTIHKIRTLKDKRSLRLFYSLVHLNRTKQNLFTYDRGALIDIVKGFQVFGVRAIR